MRYHSSSASQPALGGPPIPKAARAPSLVQQAAAAADLLEVWLLQRLHKGPQPVRECLHKHVDKGDDHDERHEAHRRPQQHLLPQRLHLRRQGARPAQQRGWAGGGRAGARAAAQVLAGVGGGHSRMRSPRSLHGMLTTRATALYQQHPASCATAPEPRTGLPGPPPCPPSPPPPPPATICNCPRCCRDCCRNAGRPKGAASRCTRAPLLLLLAPRVPAYWRALSVPASCPTCCCCDVLQHWAQLACRWDSREEVAPRSSAIGARQCRWRSEQGKSIVPMSQWSCAD